MAAVIADLRATPVGTLNPASMQFAIPLKTSGTYNRFFDSQAQCSCEKTGVQRPNPQTKPPNCSNVWSPPLQPRYRLTITWSGSSSVLYADLKVTWPAAVDPTNTTPSGAVEMFAAFDRN